MAQGKGSKTHKAAPQRLSSQNAVWTDNGWGHPKLQLYSSNRSELRYSSWGPQSGKSPGFSITFFFVGSLAAWALVAYKMRRLHPDVPLIQLLQPTANDRRDLPEPAPAREHTDARYKEYVIIE